MSRKARIVIALVTVAASVVGSQANAGHYLPFHRYNHQVIHHHAHVNPIGVAPLRVHNPLSSVPAGSSFTLPANFLGNAPGSVFLVFGNIKLPCQILNWSNEAVTIKLPPMSVRHPIRVRLDVVLPHGQLGLKKHLMLTRPADVILHPSGPTSPLPTQAALLQQAAPPVQN